MRAFLKFCVLAGLCISTSAFGANKIKFDPYRAVIKSMIFTLNACQKNGDICAVSFIDKHGLPITSAANSCAFGSTSQVASQKALGSALFGKPTVVLSIFAQPGGVLNAFQFARYKTNYIGFLAGGYPLFIGKKLFGAVGVQVQSQYLGERKSLSIKYAQDIVHLWERFQSKPELLSKKIILPKGKSSRSGLVAYYALVKGLSECDKQHLGCFFALSGTDAASKGTISNAMAVPSLSEIAKSRAHSAMSKSFELFRNPEDHIALYKVSALQGSTNLFGGEPIIINGHIVGGVGMAFSKGGFVKDKNWISLIHQFSSTVTNYFESHYRYSTTSPCQRI